MTISLVIKLALCATAWLGLAWEARSEKRFDQRLKIWERTHARVGRTRD